MWLAGGVNREKWFNYKMRAGAIIEGALRDDEGKAQGTMIIEIIQGISVDTHGHWALGRYVVASDPHMRWWMKEGAGKKLAAKCHYHFCEDASIDCKVSRRGASIHLERFREITQKDFNNEGPGWAFGKSCVKAMMGFLKSRDMEPTKEVKRDDLPWIDPGEEEDEPTEESEESQKSSGKGGLKDKLLKAKEEVERLERELTSKKPKGKEKQKERKKDSRAEEKVPSKKVEKGKAEEKKKKRKRSPSKKKEKERKRARSEEKAPRKESKGRREKKRKDSSSSEEEEESSEEQLFGEGHPRRSGASSSRGKKDRGPFGGGDVVHFQEGTSSDEEPDFQDAPAAPKASSQLKLVQYAKKTPGRLASRLLLKMQEEGARGVVGADPKSQDQLTPPAAVHYLLTMMVPQLGPKLNVRSLRELKTLCTALDHLARHSPAKAADLLCQRVKAIEKASADGHWGSAQYLELLSTEQSGLLDRAEEVFMNREYLTELKLKGYQAPRQPRPDPKGNPRKGGEKGKDEGKGKGVGKEKDKAE